MISNLSDTELWNVVADEEERDYIYLTPSTSEIQRVHDRLHERSIRVRALINSEIAVLEKLVDSQMWEIERLKGHNV